LPFSQQNLFVSGNFAIADASGTAKVGIWAVLHEIRADYAQILTTLFY